MVFTWDDLYDRADGKGFGTPELKAKDNARWELENIILQKTGLDVNTCEVPEDAIENFLSKQNEKYLFDENGNLMDNAEENNIKVEFPDVELLNPGEYSEYGKHYVYGPGCFIDIVLYKDETGKLILQIYDVGEVVSSFNVEM